MLYTLNGDLILEQNVCNPTETDDYVFSCAFYEGSGNEWLEQELVFTGHRRGVVNVWKKTVRRSSGKWGLELVKRLDHVDLRNEGRPNLEAAITCIVAMPQTVYTGDEDGRVVSFFPILLSTFLEFSKSMMLTVEISVSGIAYSANVEHRWYITA